MVRGRIKLAKKNQLLFWDGSKFKVNRTWAKALSDKLAHQKRSLKDFLEEFGGWLEERWKTKTCSDKFGIIKWEEADEFHTVRSEFTNLAKLAENELYYYLRPWIMGLIMGEHGGKVIIITDKKQIEYPSDTTSKTEEPAQSEAGSR